MPASCSVVGLVAEVVDYLAEPGGVGTDCLRVLDAVLHLDYT